MKVLHVVPRMDPRMGGVCQAVRTIIAGLNQLNVTSEVVTLDATGAAFLADERFAVHALGPGRGPWDYSAKLEPWLSQQLSGFDAVVVHGLWLFYGYAVRQAFRRLRAASHATPRLYVMPHGMLDPYFQRAPGRKLKAWRNTLYWKLIEHKLLSEATAVLFTCEEERRLATESFSPYKPQCTTVVGLGVIEPPAQQAAMLDAFAAACPSLQGKPYLLFLSRIDEKKGVDLLLRAYAEVGSVAGAALPKLVIAGPDLDTVYGRQMQQLIASSRFLQQQVLLPGMLTGAAKWGAFYGCECFILPSHQENFGIAIVEALACGKPVLISDQVNIWREIVGPGGFVAPDTLLGTQSLLTQWQELSKADKSSLQVQARAVFEEEFAVAPAAARFQQALK